jgi:hypothetical protein
MPIEALTGLESGVVEKMTMPTRTTRHAIPKNRFKTTVATPHYTAASSGSGGSLDRLMLSRHKTALQSSINRPKAKKRARINFVNSYFVG